jgi:hypothetical protein
MDLVLHRHIRDLVFCRFVLNRHSRDLGRYWPGGWRLLDSHLLGRIGGKGE